LHLRQTPDPMSQEFAYNTKNMGKLNKLGIHVPDTKGFNSGVLIMNLRRMREQDLAVSLVLQANQKLHSTWPDPDKVLHIKSCSQGCWEDFCGTGRASATAGKTIKTCIGLKSPVFLRPKPD
jgi:hypothetical protein